MNVLDESVPVCRIQRAAVQSQGVMIWLPRKTTVPTNDHHLSHFSKPLCTQQRWCPAWGCPAQKGVGQGINSKQPGKHQGQFNNLGLNWDWVAHTPSFNECIHLPGCFTCGARHTRPSPNNESKNPSPLPPPTLRYVYFPLPIVEVSPSLTTIRGRQFLFKNIISVSEDEISQEGQSGGNQFGVHAQWGKLCTQSEHSGGFLYSRSYACAYPGAHRTKIRRTMRRDTCRRRKRSYQSKQRTTQATPLSNQPLLPLDPIMECGDLENPSPVAFPNPCYCFTLSSISLPLLHNCVSPDLSTKTKGRVLLSIPQKAIGCWQPCREQLWPMTFCV